MMMVSEEDNEYPEIDHQTLATELAQLANREERNESRMRRSTYADIKLKHDAEKSAKAS